MAARSNPSHDAATRAKIRTSQLLNRLQSFALSAPDPQTGAPVSMSPDQVRAALGLLKKTLPDLTAVQHSGDATAPVFVMALPPAAEDFDQWEKRHSPATETDAE